jgi:hypothetical protein
MDYEVEDGEGITLRFRKVLQEGFGQVGVIHARVSDKANEDCLQDFMEIKQALGQGLLLFRVTESKLHPTLRGKGLGRLMYEMLLLVAANHGGAIMRDSCAGLAIDTSQGASRVWLSLSKDYLGTENVLYGRGISNG